MSNGAVAATTAAGAAAAAMARAIKAMGAIVQVKPEVFLQLLAKTESSLVIGAKGNFWNRNFKYLTNVKGFFFYTESPTALPLGSAELVWAEKIWIPS
jgi:hypothetical protein